MRIKDLSISTFLLALLYFTAYSFYRGYSSFYGFPSSFISVGIAELVKFSVIALGIMSSLLALLQLDTSDSKVSLIGNLIHVVTAIAIVFFTFYITGGGGYLFSNTIRALAGQSLLLGLFGLIGIRSISLFVKNDFEFKGRTNAVMVFAAVLLVPGGLGWAWAYLPYEPLFYSKSNNAYILENYSGKFILGRCVRENASYLIVDELEGNISPITNKETQELKTCFLRSAKGKNSLN